jgi:hypothetical protein
MAMDQSPSTELDTVRARAYEAALDRVRATPDGFLRAADAIRVSRVGVREFYAAVSAGRVRTTRFAGGLRGYQREDVEALAARDGTASQ